LPIQFLFGNKQFSLGLIGALLLINDKMTYTITKDLCLIKTKNYKTLFHIVLTLNIILVGYVVYLSNLEPVTRIVETLVPYTEINESDIVLTDSAILEELVKEGSVIPSVALAQAKIESSHYTSTVCKENHNLFGIKYHKCPFVKGQNLNHATYETYRDNIKCYVHIQKHYLGKIDGHYAEARGYVELIKKFK